MMSRHASRRVWIWLFRFERAEFYRDLADTVDISRPHCYFVDIVHGDRK